MVSKTIKYPTHEEKEAGIKALLQSAATGAFTPKQEAAILAQIKAEQEYIFVVCDEPGELEKLMLLRNGRDNDYDEGKILAGFGTFGRVNGSVLKPPSMFNTNEAKALLVTRRRRYRKNFVKTTRELIFYIPKESKERGKQNEQTTYGLLCG